MKRFEEIEHTADLAIRAHGRTIEELFENAALGLFSLIWATDSVSEFPVSRTLALEAPDRDRLLHAWLRELLYIHEADDIALGAFRITHLSGGRLEAEVSGVAVGELPDPPVCAIKAVTYHGLEIEQTREGFTAELIFDT